MIRASYVEVLVVAMLATNLVACGGSGGGGRYSEPSDDIELHSEDLGDAARQSVYDDYGANSDGTSADATRVDAYDVEDSGNYVCTQDCSGHEAGFAWAQENDLSDGSDCGGNSQSFVEGCEAFVENRQQLADETAQAEAEHAAEDAQSADEPDWEEE